MMVLILDASRVLNLLLSLVFPNKRFTNLSRLRPVSVSVGSDPVTRWASLEFGCDFPRVKMSLGASAKPVCQQRRMDTCQFILHSRFPSRADAPSDPPHLPLTLTQSPFHSSSTFRVPKSNDQSTPSFQHPYTPPQLLHWHHLAI